MTSANDAPERDPRDWTIQGSADGGATWTTVDTRTGQTFDQRYQTKSMTSRARGRTGFIGSASPGTRRAI